jgi:hypothetical protein
MFELAEAVASCLDRDSARRVNRLKMEAIVGNRLMELEAKRLRATVT